MGKILDEIRKIAEGKDMAITSFQEGRVRNLERKCESGELDGEEMMTEVEKEFGYRLKREDYKRIEKAIH